MKTTTQFLQKYTTYFIWKVCVWEGVVDRTELQYIDPPLLWPSAFCLPRSLGLLNQGGAEAHSAGCGLSLPHLATDGSDLKTLDFLSSPSYIIVQSPTQSLEWHVWSSSSGNNCHAVHSSLSSSASVYECTMGFYLVPYFQPSPSTRFLLITAIGMCHFLPVHHFGMACLAGSKISIKQEERDEQGETWKNAKKYKQWKFFLLYVYKSCTDATNSASLNSTRIFIYWKTIQRPKPKKLGIASSCVFHLEVRI